MAAAGRCARISQAGLYPANCQLLRRAGGGDDRRFSGPGKSLLVLGFESVHHPVDHWMDLALECAKDHGGEPGDVRVTKPEQGGHHRGTPESAAEEVPRSNSVPRSDAVSSWRSAFLGAPYLRDTFVACGVLSDTFETAITWDRFEDFHAVAIEAARAKVAEVCATAADGVGSPRVSCRFTHVYRMARRPTTVLAPAVRGGEVGCGTRSSRGLGSGDRGWGTITHPTRSAATTRLATGSAPIPSRMHCAPPRCG
jgi:alkyldihydroxyacetonephosphate synthase